MCELKSKQVRRWWNENIHRLIKKQSLSLTHFFKESVSFQSMVLWYNDTIFRLSIQAKRVTNYPFKLSIVLFFTFLKPSLVIQCRFKITVFDFNEALKQEHICLPPHEEFFSYTLGLELVYMNLEQGPLALS